MHKIANTMQHTKLPILKSKSLVRKERIPLLCAAERHTQRVSTLISNTRHYAHSEDKSSSSHL
jgi:hypothetical protein